MYRLFLPMSGQVDETTTVISCFSIKPEDSFLYLSGGMKSRTAHSDPSPQYTPYKLCTVQDASLIYFDTACC